MNLKRAIEIIEGGAWCSLRFITADVNKGTGGKVIELSKCRIARTRTSTSATEFKKSEVVREAGHAYHFTRNMALPNNQIRKVHPILITHLNQEEVI